MTASVLIPRQFRGPARSANGGYTCGTIAELVAEAQFASARFAWAVLDCPGGVGRPLGEPAGRRHPAVTAIFRDGTLLAMAEAVWFEMDDDVRDLAR